jgi:threonine dehydrogenase-like Zn-dependent dehydrogenase
LHAESAGVADDVAHLVCVLLRVPFADASTHPVPDGAVDEDILMLAAILPTGYEVGVLNGQVRPGDVVAPSGRVPSDSPR